MRRLETFALVLAFLLTLSACGGETQEEEENLPSQSPEEVTIYDCGGLQTALPDEYLDLLRVDTDFPDGSESWKPLISVYEKASYEAAMEEFGGGGGFLFGFLVMDQAAFEQHISADGSGISVFATDGERYYAYTYPTDVQFYRPEGENLSSHPDWPVWEKLCEIGPQVQEDFLTRNGLQSFSMTDFTSQLAAGDGNHVCVRYYPYFIKDGDTCIYYQLLLRQPARQGEGGIWAVEQWLDERGNQSLYFPDSGKPAAEYYAQLQEECDAGEHPELLIPAGAAMVFAQDYFGHESAQGSFCQEAGGVDYGYMERNQRLQDMILDLNFRPEETDGMDLLECVGEATADNWGTLGRFMYGSDWFEPLMSTVSNAAVGTEQQRRDRAVMSFLLATQDTATDFFTPLGAVLFAQKKADPDAFQAALSEFPEEDQEILLGASLPVQSAPMRSDIPEAVEKTEADIPTY